MLNIPELTNIASNITAIRLMTEDDIEANNIVNNWQKTKMYLNVEQSRIADAIASQNRLKVNIFEQTSYRKSKKVKKQCEFLRFFLD